MREVIGRYVKEFLKNREQILKGNVPTPPVRIGISFICGRSGRWVAVAGKVREQLKDRNPIDLLKEEKLKSFLDKVYKRHDTRVYKDAGEKILNFLSALRNLDSELKKLSKNKRLKVFENKLEEILKTKAKIGRKGRDNILRDYGFFNHVPIDVHEKRFLLRTGIFHKYASKEAADPTSYNDLADALKSFCKAELEEV